MDGLRCGVYGPVRFQVIELVGPRGWLGSEEVRLYRVVGVMGEGLDMG